MTAVPQLGGTVAYPIRDAAGTVIAIHERRDEPDGSKRFAWSRPDGQQGLGGIPVAALPLYGVDTLGPDPTLFLVEGERAAAALHAAGIQAVASVTGAHSTPGPASLAELTGRMIYLWPDNDAVGRDHMARIAAALNTVGPMGIEFVEWANAPEHGDAADFLATHDPTEVYALPRRPVSLVPAVSDGLVTLSSVQARRVAWLWPGYIPLGKLTIVDGDPGLGKSTMLLDIAARGSRGDATPSGTPLDVFDTILVTAEDDAADTIRPRLDAAAGDPSRVHHLPKLTLPDEADRLAAMVRRTEARLVVIDPLVAYLADGVRTNSDHEVRRALEPVARMAEGLGTAVVAIRHLNKQSGGEAIYRGGGSIGFTGLARAVLAVGRDPDDEERIVLAAVKVNVARRPPSLAYRLVADGDYDPARVVWEGETDHTAETLIGRDRDQAAEQGKAAGLADVIRGLVDANGGEMLARDAYRALEADGVVTDTDAAKRLITRARRRAGVDVAKQTGQLDGPWVWRSAR